MTPRTVIERYVAAVEQRDMETVRELFAEGATWWLGGELPLSGTWRGRDAILGDFLGSIPRLYDPDSISIEVTSLIADGDVVALEWTSRAVTAAGEDYENRCAGVFTVRDGRIVAVREYMDTQYAAAKFAAVDV
jgi:ketosteroid isomerase-like protein